MRGSGYSSARRNAAASFAPAVHSPRATPRPARASPSVPDTQTSSPSRAASRRSTASGATSPNTVTHRFSGPLVVSPPISSQR